MLKLTFLFGLTKIIFGERFKNVAYTSEVEQQHQDKVVPHPDSTNIVKTGQKFYLIFYKIFSESHTSLLNYMKSGTVIIQDTNNS